MCRLERWMLVAVLACPALAAPSEKADTSSARTAIAQAEQAVKQAAMERALWTSAEDALRKAHAALQEGNAEMAIEQARLARRYAELGLAQKHYPPFR